MEEVKVIQVSEDDLNALQFISKQTFLEAFSDQNAAEDMNSYVEASFTIQKLSLELNNKNSQFYFAKQDKEIIAYLKLNIGDAQTELKNDNSLEIERIYVLKAYHGKKVAALLYQQAMKMATDLKVDFIWLGVWEKNARAISFYKKNGFVEFDKHIFKLGNDEQMDIMMKRLL